MRTNGPREPWLLRLSTRLYRLLLRVVFPLRFRRRHGDEMVRFFRDRGRDALRSRGVAGLAVHGAAAFRDVLVNGVAERMGRGRGPHGGGGPAESKTTTGGGMGAVWRDGVYAFKALRKAPGFVAVAALTLALGIGANTAIFSVVQAVLLRPLPYGEPERLVLVWGEMPARGVENFPASPPELKDYREMSTVFEGLAGFFTFPQPLTGEFEPRQIMTAGVTTNFFSVLGVEPLLGRDFVPSEGDPVEPGAQPGDPGFAPIAAILSHGLWQQRFGGDAGVLGRVVELGGNPAEIVGVMPPGFRLLTPEASSVAEDVDAWFAMRVDFESAVRGNVFLDVVGRLRPGVTVAQAQAEMDGIAAEFRRLHEISRSTGFRVEVVSLHEDVTEHVRPVIQALLGAVGFVLLIACANVSNLLLVRGSTRGRELAVRAAMGGSRGRLVRQLMAESLLLAALGAVVGLVVARLGIHLLLALQPGNLPRIESVAVDGTVLGFTALATLVAALLFGVLPSLRASSPDLAAPLKEGGRAGSRSGGRALRNGAVVAEVGLSLVLLIGAGLMVRSFVALQRVAPGFEAEGVLTFDVTLPFGRYPEIDARTRFSTRLRERLAAIPGVVAASAAFPLPLDDRQFNGRWGLEEALADPQAFRQADYHAVLPGFFETLGTRFLEGRDFARADNLDSAAVVVVDRSLARTAFPDRSAVGERILVRASSPEPQWVEIVGVVEDQRHTSLAVPGRETVYFTDRFIGSFGALTWAVRTAGDPLASVPGVRQALEELDPLVPLADVKPMTAFVDRHRAPTRFALVLIGVFGGIALFLAAVGLYGVLAYTVRQRIREIGVRMALGARSGGIAALVVRQGLALGLFGAAVGLVAALGLTRLMAGLLVGVEPTDPLTFGGITLLFLVVAAVASWIPARRAARTDPAAALRAE